MERTIYSKQALVEGLQQSFEGFVDGGKHPDPNCFCFMLGEQAPDVIEETVKFRTGVRIAGNRNDLVALFLSCMQNENFHAVAMEAVACIVTQDAESFILFKELCDVMVDTPSMTATRD